MKSPTSLIDEAKQSVATKAKCPRHSIVVDRSKAKLGNKYSCERCGTEFRLSDFTSYKQGYVHAGGDINDIYREVN